MAKAGVVWVDVRGDTTGLTQQLQSLGSTASRSLSGLGTTVFKDMARGTAQVTAGFVALGTAGALSLTKIGASYNTLEQSSLAAFKTLLGTKEAAQEMQADLREFAKTSPFPRQAFIEGTQRLLAFGFEAKKVIPTLNGIQNAVAAAGGSASDLSGVVEVLAKIRSSAMFNIRDLTELGNRGINAAKLIAGSMGITEEEFRNSIYGAPLQGADAIKTVDLLIQGMNRDFAGAADGLKSTWVGATDRIKGAWRDLGSGLMDPFISKSGGGSAVESANSIADALRAVEKNILPVLVPLSDLLGKHMLAAATGASDFVKSIKPTQAAAAINRVIGVADKARISLKGLEGVAGGVGLAIAGIGARSVLGPLGFLVPTISPITGALGGLVLGSKEGRAALVGLGRDAKAFASTAGRDLTEGLGRFAEQLSGPVSRLLERFGGGLLDLGRHAVPVLVSAMDRIGPPLGEFIEHAGELAEKVLPALGQVLSAGVSIALPPVTAALSLAADAAGLLADNAWLLVPALGAIAAVKVTGGLTNIASTFGAIGSGMGTAIKDFNTYYQVLRAEGGGMATSLGGALNASTGLATVLSGALNPAVWAVGGAIAAGAVIWHDWQRDVVQVKNEAKELSRVLIEQGEDVLPTLARQFSDILDRSKGGEDAWRKTGMSISGVVDALNQSPGAFDAAWRKMRMFDTSVLAASEHLDLFPKSMRPVISNLRAMVDAGTLDPKEFENIIKYFKELDIESKVTADNVGLLAEQFRNAAKETKLSADAQRWLNTALNENASLEERRDALQKLTTIMPDVAAANGIVVGSSRELQSALSGAALSAEDAKAMLDRYGDATKEVGTASSDAGDEIELTQTNVDGLAESLDEARKNANELRDALLELSGGSRDEAAAEVKAWDAFNSILAKRKEALDKLTDAQTGVAEAQERLQKARDDGGDTAAAQRDLAKAQDALAKAQEATKISLDRTTEAGGKLWNEIDGLVGAWESFAAAGNDATGEKSRKRLGELLDRLRELRSEGIIPTDEAYKEVLKTLGLTPESIDIKVRSDMAAAIEDLSKVKDLAANLLPGGTADEIVVEIQTLIDNGKYQEAATRIQALLDAYDGMEVNVVANADQAGLDTTKHKIDGVAFDRSLLIRMDLDTSPAEQKAEEFRKKVLGAWQEMNLGLNWSFGSLVGLDGKRAAGGPVWPGAWLVGEHGPEILQLGNTGRVYDAATTRRMLDGKGQSGAEFSQAQLDQLLAALRERSAMDIHVTSDTADGRAVGMGVSNRLWLRGF